MCFNSRPREGGDLQIHIPVHIQREVSIHAPAKGATRVRTQITITAILFQFTPPRRGRLQNITNNSGVLL